MSGLSLAAFNSIAAQGLPNIVLILADDLGYGDISCLNPDSKVNTRNIDELSHNGIAFTDCHSNSSVSTPTRYGILTGRYAFRTTLEKGVLNGMSKPLISKSRLTMAEMLRSRGYRTACIGKWHLGWNWQNDGYGDTYLRRPILDGPTSIGFDYFFGIPASLDMPPYVYVENDRVTTDSFHQVQASPSPASYRKGIAGDDFNHEECLPKLADKAVQYLVSCKGNSKPFFLYFPLTAPHTPIVPTVEYRGRTITTYTDFVLMIDDIVGKLIKTLKDNGLYDNTLIVFTSDNGCSPAADYEHLKQLGHNPSYIYRGTKADLFDGGHRIPLIISWGNRYSGICDNSLVCLTDLMATFADLTGYQLQNGEAEDSFSMMPLLLGRKGYGRKSVVHHSIDGSFSIRKGEWKLLLSPSSGGWSYPRPGKDDAIIATLPAFQLYNMKDDPQESRNVYDNNPKVADNLVKELTEIIVQGRSTPGAPSKNDRTIEIKNK